jgi:hypothetical protein
MSAPHQKPPGLKARARQAYSLSGESRLYFCSWKVITATNEQSCPALQREVVPVSPKMKRRSTGECQIAQSIPYQSVHFLPQKNSARQIRKE